jgi:hypothetical protein
VALFCRPFGLACVEVVLLGGCLLAVIRWRCCSTTAGASSGAEFDGPAGDDAPRCGAAEVPELEVEGVV